MKKIIAMLMMTICITGTVIALDGLQISGEMRTGLFWYDLQRDGQARDSRAFIHNSQDVNWHLAPESLAGLAANKGRFRLNFLYERENIGVRFRFESNQWQSGVENMFFWGYAFAYGNFFNDSLRISAGRMGASPWGTGGPELWRELDTTLGVRFEFMPQNIPFIRPGSLNFGFVLNNFDGAAENIVDPQWPSGDLTLTDVLTETVLGFSFTHDVFHIRFAYRLDGMHDGPVFQRMLFRVEERILQRFVPGFQIFANGYFEGLNPRGRTPPDFEADASITAWNWVYIHYEPELFDAQLRLGYVIMGEQRRFAVRPGFFVNLFDGLLRAGAAFEYLMEIGDTRVSAVSPYLWWFFEPEIRFNLHTNSHISLVYRYKSDFFFGGGTQETRTHSINLRFVLTF